MSRGGTIVIIGLLLNVCAQSNAMQIWRHASLDHIASSKKEHAGNSTQHKTLIEWGSNDGGWMRSQMQALAAEGESAACYMFEVQPQFVDGPLREISEQYNCEIVPHVVWDKAGETMNFFAAPDKSIGASLFDEGAYTGKDDSAKETFEVTSVDAAQWLIHNINPASHIHLRMDIEGAEYRVIRRIITAGLACWLDVLEFEVHAMYSKQNYNKRPVDVVIPWLLRGCGVQVNFESWYDERTDNVDPVVIDAWPSGDEGCRNCELLYSPIPED